MATKSTPDGVDLKLSNYSTTAAMNGSIASANNATLATVAANYGLKTVVDQHSLDIAARITPLEVDTKVANALLGVVTVAALASELASRDASISGLQASKADASALTAYALLSAVSKIAAALLGAVTTAALDAALLGKADASALAGALVDGLDTPLEVDTKIANALLGLATEAFVAAQLASRDASITALQGAKADTTLLASYATNAALSASQTTLQSALDAILAELAALQLSGSGGVANAPAWAGFTTWELVRGSNVVRNLHLEAPLSAALANGDDTLSITADCYSIAAADAALEAALLAYYTSSQVDALLVDYRTGTAQDAETTSAISAALLAYYTSSQVTRCWPTTARQARTAGLPDGPGPGRFHNQPNHLGAGGVPLGRRPGHGNGLKHRRRPAQLLHHRTSGRFVGRQARRHGGSLCPANSRALSGRRRGRRGGRRHRRADPGPHGRLAVKLDGSPQQCGLATHTAGAASVDGYTLTLAVNLWNIVRTYNAESSSSPAGTGSARPPTSVVYMSEADNVYNPLYGSGDEGAWSTAKMYSTVPPNGVAKLDFRAHFQTPGLPNQTAGTVDVYGLQILDATLEAGNTTEVEADTTASALLLKHEFLDGETNDVTLATLGEAHAHHARQCSGLHSGRLPAGGLRHDPERLRLEHRAHLHPDGRYRLGTASNLVIYVSAADNDYVGVTGAFLGTASQGVWSTARLDFSVPPGGPHGQRGLQHELHEFVGQRVKTEEVDVAASNDFAGTKWKNLTGTARWSDRDDHA